MCLWCAASFIKSFSTSPQKMLNLNLSSKVRWFKHYVQVLRDHENIVKMVSNELSLGKTVLTAYNSGFSVWLVISKQVCKLFDSPLLEPDGPVTTSRNRRWPMWGSLTSKTRLDKGHATSVSLSKGTHWLSGPEPPDTKSSYPWGHHAGGTTGSSNEKEGNGVKVIELRSSSGLSFPNTRTTHGGEWVFW